MTWCTIAGGLLVAATTTAAPADSPEGSWTATIQDGARLHHGTCRIRFFGQELNLTCTFDGKTSTGVGRYAPATRTVVTSRHQSIQRQRLSEQTRLQLSDGGNQLTGQAHLSGAVSAVLEIHMTRVGAPPESDDGVGAKTPYSDAPLTIAGTPVHFSARTTFEAYFFGSREYFENTDTLTYDLSGRRNQLSYQVDPIFVLGVALGATLQVGGEPLELEVGYQTSRVFGSKGSVQTRATGPLTALGIDGGLVTDILDLGLQIAGLYGTVTIARFAPGTATLTGSETGTMPLLLERIMGQVGYTHTIQGLGLSLTAELRYDDYAAPRLVYELEDLNPDPSISNYRIVAESDPLYLRTRTYGADLAITWRPFQRPGWYFTTPVRLRLGMGGGPISVPGIGDTTLFNFRAGGLAGVEFRYTWDTPPGDAHRSDLGGARPWFQASVLAELTMYSQTLSAPAGRDRVFSTDDGWSVVRLSVAAGW